MNFSFFISYLSLLVIKSKCQNSDSQNKNSNTGGLKWVTFNQWIEMPGGIEGNPIVPLSTFGGDICSFKHDGCWQGGILLFVEQTDDSLVNSGDNNPPEGSYRTTLVYTYNNDYEYDDPPPEEYDYEDPEEYQYNYGLDPSRCLVAPLDYEGGFMIGDFGRNFSVRILVNPGRSVKWDLVDWDWDKGAAPPKSAVYIDNNEYCKNVVTGYTDCSYCKTNNYLEPAALVPSQRGKDRYVYYYDDGARYDSNEYKILIEEGIKKYEIISLELEESSALEDVKMISSTSEVINEGRDTADYEKNLAMEVTESSSWSHSIHWEVGFGAEIGPKGIASYTIDVRGGGNHEWGGSKENKRTASETAIGKVPPNHGRKITLWATQTQKEVPYKAQVKITYDDDSTRTVTDFGTWKNVVVTDFNTTHGEPYPLLDF